MLEVVSEIEDKDDEMIADEEATVLLDMADEDDAIDGVGVATIEEDVALELMTDVLGAVQIL